MSVLEEGGKVARVDAVEDGEEVHGVGRWSVERLLIDMCRQVCETRLVLADNTADFDPRETHPRNRGRRPRRARPASAS